MPEALTNDEVIARLTVIEKRLGDVIQLVGELIEDGTIAEQ